VVDKALQLLRDRIDNYGVRAKVDRRRRLPEIWIDPRQFEEVMVNLFVNACEAMPNGGSIVIGEEEGTTESMGGVVIVRVSDDGPGIPQSVQDKLFQPFFSTKEEGTGLGLNIAARVLEEHGGRLAVESQEGEGATFIITLPCKGGG
jgi:signal transduction histidine kinase